jgi:hypothetical protein
MIYYIQGTVGLQKIYTSQAKQAARKEMAAWWVSWWIKQARGIHHSQQHTGV